MARIDRDRIERAARIYASNADAATALGISPNTFRRLCLHYGVDSPAKRRQAREGRK